MAEQSGFGKQEYREEKWLPVMGWRTVEPPYTQFSEVWLQELVRKILSQKRIGLSRVLTSILVDGSKADESASSLVDIGWKNQWRNANNEFSKNKPTTLFQIKLPNFIHTCISVRKKDLAMIRSEARLIS